MNGRGGNHGMIPAGLPAYFGTSCPSLLLPESSLRTKHCLETFVSHCRKTDAVGYTICKVKVWAEDKIVRHQLLLLEHGSGSLEKLAAQVDRTLVELELGSFDGHKVHSIL